MNSKIHPWDLPILNRAATDARRVLRREYGARVSFRVLRRRGADLLAQQGRPVDERQPAPPWRVELLQSALQGWMIATVVDPEQARRDAAGE
jgi:hypothetical protein